MRPWSPVLLESARLTGHLKLVSYTVEVDAEVRVFVPSVDSRSQEAKSKKDGETNGASGHQRYFLFLLVSLFLLFVCFLVRLIFLRSCRHSLKRYAIRIVLSKRPVSYLRITKKIIVGDFQVAVMSLVNPCDVNRAQFIPLACCVVDFSLTPTPTLIYVGGL